MREIKFRAYDLEVKEMSFDFLNDKWLEVCIKSPYVKLMQSTGLKDKKGVEIYDGDILMSEGLNGKLYNEVFYYEEYACFEAKPINMNYCKKIRAENFCEFEVIGNIYENKELLEEKQMKVKNEIKSMIAERGYTLTKVVELLNANAPEGETLHTLAGLSNKLTRGSIKYKEVKEIADVIGMEIKWINK